eukprot:CAMPEP_0177660502 /NCGR_PEP_ID=MMETSP0447-20121125/18079_1 /TAXON_ID=0 /ORGANISM="Stygamoeba regulata, Strain BSH-02190019" /LENGTH=92 /DNA_ID=CAMNT_0019165581 /DNA_START=262 /DNA_END=537 /DNA_ORIENTATION=-
MVLKGWWCLRDLGISAPTRLDGGGGVSPDPVAVSGEEMISASGISMSALPLPVVAVASVEVVIAFAAGCRRRSLRLGLTSMYSRSQTRVSVP